MSTLAAPDPCLAPCAVPRPRGSGQPRPQYSAGFALFLVMNAALFVRPAEIVPALLGWEIYLVCILACLLFSSPAVLEQLRPRSLERRPITVCVLGFLLAVVLSHLSHFRFEDAALRGWEFFKVALYYLLFVGLVTTPARLRAFLRCFVLFATVVAALAVLQYHHVITLPNLTPIKDSVRNAVTGQETVIYRLRGSGVFQDPNDLCILLVVCILLSLYWLTDRRSGFARVAMIGPLMLFFYALTLTQSRGGMLGLLGGLFVFLWARFGWSRALLLGTVLVPLLFLASAGRQTSFSTAEGTGQARIQLWSDGLALFRKSPLFGIGAERYGEEVGQVAHNSYVHAYADLGLLGGTLFVGAFALAGASLHRMRSGCGRIVDPELRRLHPYLFGIIASFAVCMLSLSLCYIIPTFTILALACVYRSMAHTSPPLPAPRCDASLAMRLTALSIAVLVGFNVFVRLFVVWR